MKNDCLFKKKSINTYKYFKRFWLLIVLLFGIANLSFSEEEVSKFFSFPTITNQGILWNDYSVRVRFSITRDVKPTTTTYFKVYLKELDVLADNKFGPNSVCLRSQDWYILSNGKYQIVVRTTFKNVSGFWGTDWSITNHCVCEVECPLKDARVGGGLDTDNMGNYNYTYLIENDPEFIAMDSTATITGFQISSFNINFTSPIARGDSLFITATSPNLPAIVDDVPGEATIPYLLYFSDGSTLEGLAIGPLQATVPTLSQWGLILLCLLLLCMSTVTIIQKQYQFTSVGGDDTLLSVKTKLPLFNSKLFWKTLPKVLIFVPLALIFFYFVYGFITTADIFGTLLSGGIIAYFIHFILLSNRILHPNNKI